MQDNTTPHTHIYHTPNTTTHTHTPHTTHTHHTHTHTTHTHTHHTHKLSEMSVKYERFTVSKVLNKITVL